MYIYVYIIGIEGLGFRVQVGKGPSKCKGLRLRVQRPVPELRGVGALFHSKATDLSGGSCLLCVLNMCSYSLNLKP